MTKPILRTITHSLLAFGILACAFSTRVALAANSPNPSNAIMKKCQAFQVATECPIVAQTRYINNFNTLITKNGGSIPQTSSQELSSTQPSPQTSNTTNYNSIVPPPEKPLQQTPDKKTPSNNNAINWY
jgi:hypothetical protein